MSAWVSVSSLPPHQLETVLESIATPSPHRTKTGVAVPCISLHEQFQPCLRAAPVPGRAGLAFQAKLGAGARLFPRDCRPAE